MENKLKLSKLIRTKAKLRKKSISLGAWLQIGNTNSAEILSSSESFDWVCIDLEHSAISIEKCEDMIRTIETSGSLPIVRLTSNNSNQIKRVMDSGSLGIIVPMANSLKEVQKAYDSMHYFPRGNRGVGLARAQAWGKEFDSYKDKIDKETLLIPQIEHVDAVRNIDEIFSSNLIDAYLVGPYDLSSSLGSPGDFTTSEYKKALRHIKSTAKKYKIPSGYHLVDPDIKQLKKLIKEDYQFIAYGMDTTMLRDSAKIYD